MKLFRVLFQDGERDAASIVAAKDDIEAVSIFEEFFFGMGLLIIDVAQAPVITAGGIIDSVNIAIQED